LSAERSDRRFVIITGLSGAGKTRALQSMEDLGYYAVDNIPPGLMPRFAELLRQVEGKPNVALVADLRGEAWFGGITEAIQSLERIGSDYDLLFLTARDDVLVRRYKESRRQHPLAPDGNVLEGIRRERARLEAVKEKATLVIDTSDLSPHELKARLADFFGSRQPGMVVELLSFGFKHGLPLDADLVLDVRFLPNPHYVEDLRQHPGTDPAVQSWLFSHREAEAYYETLRRFVAETLEEAARDGRGEMVVAIGCTGGRHRSVAVAERLARDLTRPRRRTVVHHRDLTRGERP
jgi:UPF0042 nucleotide-binding protein